MGLDEHQGAIDNCLGRLHWSLAYAELAGRSPNPGSDRPPGCIGDAVHDPGLDDRQLGAATKTRCVTGLAKEQSQ